VNGKDLPGAFHIMAHLSHERVWVVKPMLGTEPLYEQDPHVLPV